MREQIPMVYEELPRGLVTGMVSIVPRRDLVIGRVAMKPYEVRHPQVASESMVVALGGIEGENARNSYTATHRWPLLKGLGHG